MKTKPSFENKKKERAFYVVAIFFVVVAKQRKGLFVKRSDEAKIHAGKWAPVGGKLEWDDFLSTPPTRVHGVVDDWVGILETLVCREAMEEARVRVGHLKYLGSVLYVRPDGIPCFCIKMAGEHLGGDPQLTDEFTSVGWFADGELDASKCVAGLCEELKIAIDLVCQR